MRILLVAEGSHELHGSLESLVRRFVPEAVTISEITKKRMSDPEIGHISGRGNRLEKRILSAMRLAVRQGYEALVLLIDEDGDVDRRRSINQAQESTMFRLPRAIGIAIKTFDAWMLADETAISRALNQTVSCQPAPEEISDPKELFAALHRKANCPLRIQEAYEIVAKNLRPDIVAERSPHSFAPFAQRLRNLI